MHVLDNRGEVWKTFIVLIPTLGAALIAVSRIMDARHHPFDVISGSLLGIVVAWAAYRQYFPPPSESWRKGRAYPIRTWATEPKRPEDRGLTVDEEVNLSQSGATANHEGNVFRQQISKSQRQRQNNGREGFGMSSSSSLDLEGNHTRKPLPSARPQIRRDPSGWSTSDLEADGGGFEMQPQHGRQADAIPGHMGQHPTVTGLPMGTSGHDTSYHQQTPGTGHSGIGDSDAEGHRPGRMDLVETYR